MVFCPILEVVVHRLLVDRGWVLLHAEIPFDDASGGKLRICICLNVSIFCLIWAKVKVIRKEAYS